MSLHVTFEDGAWPIPYHNSTLQTRLCVHLPSIQRLPTTLLTSTITSNLVFSFSSLEFQCGIELSSIRIIYLFSYSPSKFLSTFEVRLVCEPDSFIVGVSMRNWAIIGLSPSDDLFIELLTLQMLGFCKRLVGRVQNTTVTAKLKNVELRYYTASGPSPMHWMHYPAGSKVFSPVRFGFSQTKFNEPDGSEPKALLNHSLSWLFSGILDSKVEMKLRLQFYECPRQDHTEAPAPAGWQNRPFIL